METNQLYLYKLKFSAPLHISNEREDYASGTSMIHSDTLYAALFFAFNRLGKSEWIPNSQKKEPGFVISSLFPYFGDIYFLPRPLYSSDTEKAVIEDTKIRKSIKKSNWVDTEIFENILNDEAIQFLSKKNFRDGFWSAKELPEKPFLTSRVMPRSSVSRVPGEDTKIFYIERFFFDEKAGLYFLAQFDTQVEKQHFESALNFLGDEGIGTDRNIGHGKFSFTVKPSFILTCNKQHGLSVNLGLYCPATKNETLAILNHKAVGYDLLKRGGWLSEPYQSWRKKSVFMFKEGSVLNIDSVSPYFSTGINIDVNPESVPVSHPVWRCGKTIFLSF